MNQVDTIVNVFLTRCTGLGLDYLWNISNHGWRYDYKDIPTLYNEETAFFLALEYLLTHQKCRLRSNGEIYNNEDIEQMSPQCQLNLVKEIWIGKNKMDRMDEENECLNWWFLVYCPYYLSHRIINKNGKYTWFVG